MPSTHLRSKANLNLLLSFPLSLPWCHDDLARLLQYEILINIKLKVFTYHQTWKPLSWSHLDASFGLFGRWVGHVTRHDNTWQIAPWKSCFPGHMTIWLEIKMVANVVYTSKMCWFTLMVITLATPASVGQDCVDPKRRSDKRTVVTGQGNWLNSETIKADHITRDVVYWSGNEKLCCPWDIILQ